MIGGVALLVLILVGGPWIYVTFLNDDQPAKPSLPTVAAMASSTTAGSLNGSWSVGTDSFVGYRVKETLFGQSSDGVGRTSDVTGDLTVVGNVLTAAKFTADMTTVKSDKSQPDGQFRGRIMDTGSHPTATFVSTAPLAVPAEALAGRRFTSKASGDLTLRGKTKSVMFQIEGQKSGAGFDVTPQIPIACADFDIDNPSGGPATVGDKGTLEILLKLVPNG